MPSRPKSHATPKAPKKKSPATGRSARRIKKSPAQSDLYCHAAPLTVVISDRNPNQADARGPFAALAEAKSAALDAIVAAIEDAERLLCAVKRATTLAELRAASQPANQAPAKRKRPAH